MFILGFDPGFNGGVTLLSPKGEIMWTRVMPILGVGKEKTIDVYTLSMWLDEIPYGSAITAVIEKVGSRPGQGLSSTFKFGYNAGMLEGMLQAKSIPFTFVRPQAWMSRVLPGMNHDSKPSVPFCQKRFPHIDWRANERCKVGHDGKTDSCCLALYGLDKFVGSTSSSLH